MVFFFLISKTLQDGFVVQSGLNHFVRIYCICTNFIQENTLLEMNA